MRAEWNEKYGRVTLDQAIESAGRLVNSRFNQEPGARVSIPARPHEDDDLILTRFLYALKTERDNLTPEAESAWFCYRALVEDGRCLTSD